MSKIKHYRHKNSSHVISVTKYKSLKNPDVSKNFIPVYDDRVNEEKENTEDNE